MVEPAACSRLSNMRSMRRLDEAQTSLPFDVAPHPSAPRPPSGGRRAGRRAAPGNDRHRLVGDSLAHLGLPAGTEVTLEEGPRRPVRGDVILARVGTLVVAGVFDIRFGRAVLRWNGGAVWLGPSTEVLGVVVAAEAPLPDVDALLS